jgi:hypothetical protein
VQSARRSFSCFLNSGSQLRGEKYDEKSDVKRHEPLDDARA